MVMNRLEVFHFDAKAVNALILTEYIGHVADDVFDEFRVFVGLFGNVLFIGALEQAVKLA